MKNAKCRMQNAIHRAALRGTAPALALALLLLSGAPARAGEIVVHPSKLKYAERDYQPPKAADYRNVLPDGVVAFIAEDHDFPLIDISITVRTGSYLEPTGKEGLASMTGSQMRAGGTKSIKADDFDEEADFLAATISSYVGETQGGASVGCLAKDLDRALDLFFDMLRNPAFQQDRLDLAKAQALEAMKRRNDQTSTIESREWNRLMRGKSHFTSRQSTKASIDTITREDLAAFHKRFFHPGGFIIAASGDFKKDELLAKLAKRMEGWEEGMEDAPLPPKPEFTPPPGLYLVNKEGINQGRISLGHLGAMRDSPDRHALLVMNDILGGGGFTSRIMSRVRSDEGLAYSAGSSFGLGVYYEDPFRAAFQSKSRTCAEATKIVLEEIARIRESKVSETELRESIDSIVESFPRRFATPAQIVSTFADDEYTGREPKYWEEFRGGIKAVTAEEVMRVAKQYLQPEKLAILAVGDVEGVLKGNPDKPDVQLEKLAPEGKVVRIGLPDPLTLEYPEVK